MTKVYEQTILERLRGFSGLPASRRTRPDTGGSVHHQTAFGINGRGLRNRILRRRQARACAADGPGVLEFPSTHGRFVWLNSDGAGGGSSPSRSEGRYGMENATSGHMSVVWASCRPPWKWSPAWDLKQHDDRGRPGTFRLKWHETRQADRSGPSSCLSGWPAPLLRSPSQRYSPLHPSCRLSRVTAPADTPPPPSP